MVSKGVTVGGLDGRHIWEHLGASYRWDSTIGRCEFSEPKAPTVTQRRAPCIVQRDSIGLQETLEETYTTVTN